METYAPSRGFGGTLAFGRRPALLIIDFVRAYLDPGSPLYAGVEDAHAVCKDLLAFCRLQGIPVIHTRVAYQPGGGDGGVFFKKVPALACFEEGRHPELAQFADGLAPAPGETVITKQYASAFFGTPLSSLLASRSIDTVIIAGLSTSGCVRASAVDCCQHGFVPFVVSDAVGDRTQAVHDANLFDLHSKYAEVATFAQIRTLLART